MGIVILLIGLAIVGGVVLYRNPELKLKVFAALGGLIALIGGFWEQISAWAGWA